MSGTSKRGPGSLNTGLLPVTLLIAKRCITKCWLSPDPPTMHMVLEQLNLYLMDQIYVERYPESEAKSFFKKWRAFILSNLKSDEIRELMLSFRNTKWYHTE